MNKTIRKIGHYISQISIIGMIKPFALKLIVPIEKKNKNRIFLSRGIKILKEFDEILTDNNINYSLVFGSLLGAEREKGFIKHDLDIDTAVWHDQDYKKIEGLLVNSGFELIRRSETDNGSFGREDTYEKEGVQIDIFYFYPYDKEMSYTTVYVPFTGCSTIEESIKKRGGAMPIQLILPFSLKTERVKFESINVPVITNRIEFLEARYGKSWRIPDPSFVFPKMGDVRCRYRMDKITKILIWK